MKETNNKIYEVFLAVIKFLFSVDTLVTVLFLSAIAVLLVTVYSINLVAFGFTLSIVLFALSILLNIIQSN